MTYLEVSGASLYYESVGKGPMLLCISGANGSVEPWRRFAEHLKDHFTVVMYDRRGFSRSYLSGEQDYEHRIETDADDVAHLIRHVSPHEPAIVLANSSGAVVSLVFLTRHPDLIRTVLSYEPPAYRLLPDYKELGIEQQKIYDTYRRLGIPPALDLFCESIKVGDERPGLLGAFNPRNGPHISGNAMYWFERELLYYVMQDFDVDEIKRYKDKLILVQGEQSNSEAPQVRPNAIIAEKLGLELAIFPGAHLGFASHPQQFAQKLLEVLRGKNDSWSMSQRHEQRP